MVKKYDVLFYKGNGLLSKVIKLITKGEYSHVGIFIDEYHIVEINYNFTYKLRHNKYRSGAYDVYRCNVGVDENAMTDYIHNTLGQRYDFRELLRCLGLKVKDNKDRVICSECVYDLFKAGGVDLLDNDIVTPHSLSESKYLTRIY